MSTRKCHALRQVASVALKMGIGHKERPGYFTRVNKRCVTVNHATTLASEVTVNHEPMVQVLARDKRSGTPV